MKVMRVRQLGSERDGGEAVGIVVAHGTVVAGDGMGEMIEDWRQVRGRRRR